MIIPKYVSYAISKIEEKGFSAYVVGGCVRDSLLGKTPADWDITTSAMPHEIQQIFQHQKVIPTGIKHGTVTVIIDEVPLEITTFRIDGDYKDNRRPENVTFSANIEDDLSRRDFSVNAMAYSHQSGIVDPFCGQKDLKHGIIRAVGDPKMRFCEDALRIMRAIRFATQLNFEIESDTFHAMKICANLLENISAERITSEFSKTLVTESLGNILGKTFDITSPLFFGESSKKDFVGFENVLDSIPQDAALRLAAYIILAVSGLDKDCLILAKSFFDRMKFPNKVKSVVLSVLSHWNGTLPDDKISVRKMISQTGFVTFQNLLTLKLAFNPEEAAHTKDIFDTIIKNNDCCDPKNLDISGHDLSTFNLSGRQTGAALQFLLDAVICEKCENKKDVLFEYLKENFL